MKILFPSFFAGLMLTHFLTFSQEGINLTEGFVIPDELALTKKDSLVVSSWMAGIGINAVDDAGSEFSDFFNVADNWNVVPYPSRISIGKYFKNGLGLELIGAYNRYQEGNTVDEVVVVEDIDYWSVDFRASYDLNKILGETGFFDPYVGIGAGYTDANNQGRGTFNAAVGFRTWLSDRWGLDFNSMGKWTMDARNTTNHIQHAAGVVYRFNMKKELSPKGLEKLQQILALEEQFKQEQDSIAAAQLAADEEEARKLDEQLRLEEENRLARASEEEGKTRRQGIDDAIKEIGHVYFAFKSSYLDVAAKIQLEQMASVLKSNPSVIIRIESHTDSRGKNKFNDWLSERRVNRTRDYLITMGVEANRLEGEAYGESRLMNECDNNTYCPEEKHRQNRRSEFRIIEY